MSAKTSLDTRPPRSAEERRLDVGDGRRHSRTGQRPRDARLSAYGTEMPAPLKATIVLDDPAAMCRGAPLPAKTRAFIDFVVETFRRERLAERFAGSIGPAMQRP